MIIYLSGKISGLDPAIAAKKFEFFQQEIEKYGHTVINPMKLSHTDAKHWEDYLSNDIIILFEQVDAIFAIYDWQDSLGARLEIKLFEKLKRPIYYTLNPFPNAAIPDTTTN